MGERKCEHKTLVRKCEGKEFLGRQRHKYDNNIKMGLK
jgi:hypothetical protein